MQETRRQGIKKIAIGIAALTIATVAFALLKMNNMTAYGVGWGVPGAIILVGLVELVAGVPFMTISSKWDSLKGWQRGVLGTLLVVITPIAILGLFVAIITLTG